MFKKHLKRLLLLQQLLGWIRLHKVYEEEFQLQLVQLRWLMNTLKEKNVKITELRAQQDTTSISQLVEAEFGLPNIKVRRTTHLGSLRLGSSKPRLLLVELEDVSSKRNILKQATKLRKSSTWPNIYVAPDLTPKEHSQNKLLRDELKSTGEDLNIKRGKIVSRLAGACTPTVPSN